MMDTIPALAADFRSTHGLKTLTLYTGDEMDLEFTTEDKFALARYLHQLFPLVSMDTSIWDEGTAGEEFWGFIKLALSFARTTRSEAIRDARVGCNVM
jgi:hypothetical protein